MIQESDFQDCIVYIESDSRSCSETTSKPLLSKKSNLESAYERAGLSSWVNASSSKGSQPPSASAEPGMPLATLECSIVSVSIALPHDRDVGTAQRYTELWAKAFQQVCPSSCSSQEFCSNVLQHQNQNECPIWRNTE